MLKRIIIALIILFIFNSASLTLADEMKPGEFLVLTYHAVPVKTSLDSHYSVPRNRFAEQMEYLRTHGYNPVSLTDILRASEGKHVLPKNPVLLTFDDAYISYYEFVVPVLEMFGYPSVLAVVGSFIDNPPKDLPEPVMNWGRPCTTWPYSIAGHPHLCSLMAEPRRERLSLWHEVSSGG